MEPKANPVTFYMQLFYCLDNFSSFAIVWRNRVWPTAEHAYQAAKFDDETIIAQILEAKSAHDAKKIAKANSDKKHGDWAEIKLPTMETILRLKLTQHQYVQKRLLQTGEREIIEDSPTDDFWGCGPNNDGQNHVGKIWMKLRVELLEQLNKELADYLDLVSNVLKKTSGAILSMCPINPDSEEYKQGFRHIIVLPWPKFDGDSLKTVISFVRSSIDIFAEPRKIEPLIAGPTGAAGGVLVLYVGLKAKSS